MAGSAQARKLPGGAPRKGGAVAGPASVAAPEAAAEARTAVAPSAQAGAPTAAAAAGPSAHVTAAAASACPRLSAVGGAALPGCRRPSITSPCSCPFSCFQLVTVRLWDWRARSEGLQGRLWVPLKRAHMQVRSAQATVSAAAGACGEWPSRQWGVVQKGAHMQAGGAQAAASAAAGAGGGAAGQTATAAKYKAIMMLSAAMACASSGPGASPSDTATAAKFSEPPM